jgi:serine/threonine protein kinase
MFDTRVWQLKVYNLQWLVHAWCFVVQGIMQMDCIGVFSHLRKLVLNLCMYVYCSTSTLQVRLVCEYCDKGSLREALDLGAFTKADGGINYPAVLDTAIEIATAVAHLHHKNVLHSDLKARNIMLKSTGGGGRGVTAKVRVTCCCTRVVPMPCC